jgi:hypothetical protein
MEIQMSVNHVNQFSISSSWEPRLDSAERLGQRTLQNLDVLERINPYFCNWNFLDLRRDPREMTEDNVHEFLYPLDEMRGHMTAMVENGVRLNDDREPEPAGGYSVSVCTENPDPSLYVTLFARGGGVVDPRAGLRFAQFDTSRTVAPDRTIVSYPVFKAVLLSIVSAWDVRHAQAYSDDLSKMWNQPSKHFLDLAWMTYLEPALAQKVAPPRDVLVERTDDGGLLMIAAEETFDTANPAHMAAARSISKALAGVNAEEEKEWERLWPRRRTP